MVRDPVALALERLKTFEPREGYYLAFSGGKDSTVVLDLVRRAGVKCDIHHGVTTVDPPELWRFVRSVPGVIYEYPKKNMFQIIVETGLPTFFQRKCCLYLKEGGGRGRVVLTGVRWAESARRRKRKLVEPCIKPGSGNKTFVNVIVDWTDADVWRYIAARGLKICSLYAEGARRLGCVLCPLATQPRRMADLERYPKTAAIYFRAARLHLERRRAMGAKVPFVDHAEYWGWWLSGVSLVKYRERQCAERKG